MRMRIHADTATHGAPDVVGCLVGWSGGRIIAKRLSVGYQRRWYKHPTL